VAPQVIEYDPWDFPFAQGYCIDTLLSKTNKYKEKLVEYQGNDPVSMKILKKNEDKKDKE
jgi:hypothetical protein